ncbi:MAG: S-ribosylhomocysteine lyase [Candidatus Coproplasma sp.]
MDKIPSFQKDHNTLLPGLYKSMEMQGVITWDLRFKKPNAGDYITPKALHTTEHLLATALRNSARKDEVIYFGPMGCRTGYYLLTVNMGYEEVKTLLIDACAAALELKEIPGNKKEECGNYLEHDLEQAREDIAAYAKLLAAL